MFLRGINVFWRCLFNLADFSATFPRRRLLRGNTVFSQRGSRVSTCGWKEEKADAWKVRFPRSLGSCIVPNLLNEALLNRETGRVVPRMEAD